MYGWQQLIDDTFNSKFLRTRTYQDLYPLQAVFVSTVLEKVLLNTYGMKLAQLYDDSPQVILVKHEIHQTSSSFPQRIAIILSNKLSNITISTSKSRTTFLEEFDKSEIKFDKF